MRGSRSEEAHCFGRVAVISGDETSRRVRSVEGAANSVATTIQALIGSIQVRSPGFSRQGILYSSASESFQTGCLGTRYRLKPGLLTRLLRVPSNVVYRRPSSEK